METKHTPGPWQQDDENQICADNRVIATVPFSGNHAQDDANAALIAAAPRLLAALVQIAYSDFNAEAARAKARFAVEKACP